MQLEQAQLGACTMLMLVPQRKSCKLMHLNLLMKMSEKHTSYSWAGLVYAGGLINAIYSSCNGQIAATKEESFPKEIPTPTPYFQPVTDQCFQYAPEKEQSWEVKIPGHEVAAAIGYHGNPADIRILEKGPSGRILTIGAGNQKIFGAEFRKAVGYDRLRSTLITEMNYDGQNFVFKGMGWGNGVGLCQWGAYTYAQQGKTAEDIVKTYYVGADVIKLWQ